jgi:hypothetical protein
MYVTIKFSFHNIYFIFIIYFYNFKNNYKNIFLNLYYITNSIILINNIKIENKQFIFKVIIYITIKFYFCNIHFILNIYNIF